MMWIQIRTAPVVYFWCKAYLVIVWMLHYFVMVFALFNYNTSSHLMMMLAITSPMPLPWPAFQVCGEEWEFYYAAAAGMITRFATYLFWCGSHHIMGTSCCNAGRRTVALRSAVKQDFGLESGAGRSSETESIVLNKTRINRGNLPNQSLDDSGMVHRGATTLTAIHICNMIIWMEHSHSNIGFIIYAVS